MAVCHDAPSNVSTDSALSADDGFVGQIKASALAVGQGVKLAPDPTGVTAAGKFLIAVIDPANVVTEASETNNSVASTAFP